MDEFNKIRNVINDELEELTVTDRLKKKTMKKILKKEKPLFMYFNGQLMKSFTLLSTIVIITSLSFNLFFKNNTTPHVIYNMQSLSDRMTKDSLNNHSYNNYSLSSTKTENETTDQKG